MKRKLLKTKTFRAFLAVTGMLLSGTIFGQTTIGNGQTRDASSIPANTAVIIASGGTLNMDANRSFSSITTTGNTTSTISGTAELTVNAGITIAANNTLSVAPIVTAASLTTTLDDNQSANLAGTGTIRGVSTVTINAGNNDDATLSIGSGFTLEVVGNITGSGGNAGTNHIVTVNGILKIGGAFTGIDDLNNNTNSLVEYTGNAAQTIYDAGYFHLSTSGTGTKTLAGSFDVLGNIIIEAGSTLSLGNSTITINTNTARTTTINGTLNMNGDGRLLKLSSANKTLVIGAQGVLNLTDVHSGNGLELPVFGNYTFDASSTVNYGAADDQIIADIAAPGYGNLTISGASGTKDAQGNMDIQGDLTITSSTFDAGNFTHSVKGNWVRNGGTFTTGTGRISFTGAVAQTIGGSQATTFYAVTFANTNGGVTLLRPTTISNNATFTSGVVTSDATNVLIFNDNATSSLLASNAATTSYVNGPVRKVGNDAFVFPIGGATGFVPLGISAPDNTGDALTAQYFRGVPTDREDITVAGIVRLSTCDYWTITENADAGSATSVTATFYWNANNPCTGASNYVTSPAAIRAVRYSGTSWNAASAGVGSGTPAAGQVVFTGVSSFNQFTLGSTSIDENPLPVVFGDVKAYEKNSGVQIEWSNLTEKDVLEYTIERSANGRDFSAIGTQLPSSNQDDKASYIAFDAVPAAGANYYRIKAEETTGKIVYSKILSVNLGKNDAGLRLYPNPVSGSQVTISLSNVKHGQYNLRVVSAAGQDIFRQVIRNQGNSLTQTVDLPATMKPGVYNLVVTGDNYRATNTFIVQ